MVSRVRTSSCHDSRGATRFDVLAMFLVSILTLAILAPLGAVHAAAQSPLTVTSEDNAGNLMPGYYALLTLGNHVAAAGFTPLSFILIDGQTYAIQVYMQVANPDNSGSCQFDHWADTGSTSTYRAITISTYTQITAVYDCGATSRTTNSSASSVTIDSVDQNGTAISGYFAGLAGSGGNVVATGFTPVTFTTKAGAAYSLEADSHGNCTFSSWYGGDRNDPMPFTASSGVLVLTAAYNCMSKTSGGGVVGAESGESGAGPGTITIYDHRVPQSDWAACFALVCNAGTGPGASMWVVLYDSAGTIVASGFSNENGLTFTGLNVNATYFIYPTDCDLCHGGTHDVLFSFWGGGSTGSSTRPLAVIANGASLDAWYTCNNGCGGY